MTRHRFITGASFALLVLLAASSAACVDENGVALPRAPHLLTPSDDVGLTSGCNDGAPPVGRLRGLVYVVAPETRRLPDFRALVPLGALCMDRLAVTERRSFPGVRDRGEWIAIDFEGTFTIATPGRYHFRLSADDGAKLAIDGTPVIDDDGYHVTKSVDAEVGLTAGTHRIEVPYWQGPGPLTLVLEAAPANAPYEVFDLARPLAGGAP